MGFGRPSGPRASRPGRAGRRKPGPGGAAMSGPRAAPKARVDEIGLLPANIEKRLVKEQRGQGRGADYKPFLTVRDVPSRGRSHRRVAMTHGRVVQVLSDLELNAFHILDWRDDVVDIREQFPLEIDKTIAIAGRLGIPHPAFQGKYQVMTTDLVIDRQTGAVVVTEAVAVKNGKDLEDPRVVEKLEIERRYWEGKNARWGVFTEAEAPAKLVRNIRWVAPHLHGFDLDGPARKEVFGRIRHALDTWPDDKAAGHMAALDKRHGAERGAHLRYLRHLLAQGAFSWDMENVDHRSLRAGHLTASDRWIAEEYEYVHAQ